LIFRNFDLLNNAIILQLEVVRRQTANRTPFIGHKNIYQNCIGL